MTTDDKKVRSASANRPDEVSEAVFEERIRIEKPILLL
jgi:hypothetical protein